MISCNEQSLTGVWNCHYDGILGVAKWQQVLCNTPEGLEFAGSSVIAIAIIVTFIDSLYIAVNTIYALLI